MYALIILFQLELLVGHVCIHFSCQFSDLLFFHAQTSVVPLSLQFPLVAHDLALIATHTGVHAGQGLFCNAPLLHYPERWYAPAAVGENKID